MPIEPKTRKLQQSRNKRMFILEFGCWEIKMLNLLRFAVVTIRCAHGGNKYFEFE